MRRLNHWTAAVLVFSAFSFLAQALAGVIYVKPGGNDVNTGLSWDQAKGTVTAGLNAADNVTNSQIWVAAGTYNERITLRSGVAIYGGFAGTENEFSQRDFAAHVTILDGQQGGSVVAASSVDSTGCIDGFTFRNGLATNGGGLNLSSSSPTIANCTICENIATYKGGGLYLSSSSPAITNCTIRGNDSSSSSSAYGGGLYLASSSSPAITNCTISGNIATSSGGGLYLDSSSPTIANCAISGNGASSNGGGLYLSSSSSPTIANTIVAFNSSGMYKSGGTPVLWNNCVFGNTKYDYSGLTDPTGTNGNIKQDPKLADVSYGDLHIQTDSPCVNTGNDGYAQSSWTDMDGQPRMQGTVDIGADESDGTTWPVGPQIIVRVSLQGNDANDGSSWALAKRTVQAGIEAVALMGGDVWVAGGTYLERITLRPYAHVYGGFAGTETARTQRNWTVNVTILDGQQGGLVVTAQGVAVYTSTLDGLTLRDGSSGYGGGVSLSGASPTIANCTISGNRASYSGGGLYLSSASCPTITGCTISGNTGGGLYLTSSSPTLTNCTISGNSNASDGGGLYLASTSAPTITNCTISGNITTSSGGGLYLSSSSPTISNCTISGNSGVSNGGGLYLLSSSCRPTITDCTINENSVSGTYAQGGGMYLSSAAPTITNCTIDENSVSGTYAQGGGLCLFSSSATIRNCTINGNSGSNSGGGLYLSSSSPAIAHCTISGNGATSGGGLYLAYASPTVANTIVAFNNSGILKYSSSGTPVLRNNCVFGNSGYDYSSLMTDPTGTNGNLKQDPTFVDNTTGNFQLLANSPCIDQGGDNDAQPNWEDLDGHPRLAGPHVDIGAYEHPFTITADADRDGQVTQADLAVVLSSIDLASGQAGYWGKADFDGDGAATSSDLSIVLANMQ